MRRLDPHALVERIARAVPAALHGNLFVAGSLAAAYHHRLKLDGGAISTKDADLVVHPAGAAGSCAQVARSLRESGWRNTRDCLPQPVAEPAEALRAIRLLPPDSDDYFVEFLNLPDADQTEARRWIPVRLADGWYGLPSFRFLGVAAAGRVRSHAGLECARSSMMALANLLSHPRIGAARIESEALQGVLRSAKDLGRVLALAHLEGRDAAERWLDEWLPALQACFPTTWRDLAATAGDGLKELLGDVGAMGEARATTDIGLLNGLGVTADMLRATGERLMLDVIEPLRNAAGQSFSSWPAVS